MRPLNSLFLLVVAWLPVFAGSPTTPTSATGPHTSIRAHVGIYPEPPHTAAGQTTVLAPASSVHGGSGPSVRAARPGAAGTHTHIGGSDGATGRMRATARAVAHARLGFVRALQRSCTGILATYSSTAPPGLHG